tara:strand:- start:128 stop:457 length:330 start_codon:yes stop_codon:yes gene_type:complete
MPEPTYKNKTKEREAMLSGAGAGGARGVIGKAYANASRKAARSAEVADDGAEAARKARKRDLETNMAIGERSGKVIKPKERDKGLGPGIRRTPEGSAVMKSFYHKYAIT